MAENRGIGSPSKDVGATVGTTNVKQTGRRVVFLPTASTERTP